MYIECVCYLGVTLLAWGRLGSISALFVNQPVVLLVQLNVGNMEEGKIATAWHSLVRLKESINVYKNACATLGNFC
jgi:hypothetical protein